MALVEVIAGTNGRVACPPLHSESRIAFEADATGVSVQCDKGEDAAADLEHGDAVSERILLHSSGKTGAHTERFVARHGPTVSARPLVDLPPYRIAECSESTASTARASWSTAIGSRSFALAPRAAAIRPTNTPGPRSTRSAAARSFSAVKGTAASGDRQRRHLLLADR